jgi:hypothetical protein
MPYHQVRHSQLREQVERIEKGGEIVVHVVTLDTYSPDPLVDIFTRDAGPPPLSVRQVTADRRYGDYGGGS